MGDVKGMGKPGSHEVLRDLSRSSDAPIYKFKKKFVEIFLESPGKCPETCVLPEISRSDDMKIKKENKDIH